MNDSFIMIPINKINKNKNRNELILLSIIDANSKKLGYAYGTNKYYAEILGCSIRTISSLLKKLVSNNYIHIENPRSFRRKIYVRSRFLSN